jgi:AcrR family transcriptional regulator
MTSLAKRVGRPRCEASHQAILNAAVELLNSAAVHTISIEGIAAKAGVSKQTIYKWWPSKSALVMEAYAGAFTEKNPVPQTGDFEGDLREFTRRVVRTSGKPNVTRVLAELLAEAQRDDSIRRDMRERFIEARRKPWRALIAAGIAAGKASREVDVELCLDLLFGPVWYRILFRSGKLDEAFADAVSGHLLTALKEPQARGLNARFG